jgi:hypothetical protein
METSDPPTAALPDWDPRVGWDDPDRPPPDCAHGLWLEASRWRPEHGALDASGYCVPPAGTRCVGCAEELARYPELTERVRGSDGRHYHCGNCAAYLAE